MHALGETLRATGWCWWGELCLVVLADERQPMRWFSDVREGLQRGCARMRERCARGLGLVSLRAAIGRSHGVHALGHSHSSLLHGVPPSQPSVWFVDAAILPSIQKQVNELGFSEIRCFVIGKTDSVGRAQSLSAASVLAKSRTAIHCALFGNTPKPHLQNLETC